MRPVSESTSRVVSQNFSRKYIALGRIVSQWSDIMGEEFANKAQPVKLNYRKFGNGKTPSATLEILTSSAHATVLNYQKGLILERINRIFGDKWITDIRFITAPNNIMPPKQKKRSPHLTEAENSFLSGMLDHIEDQDMKIKLENLGKAILTENIS